MIIYSYFGDNTVNAAFKLKNTFMADFVYGYRAKRSDIRKIFTEESRILMYWNHGQFTYTGYAKVVLDIYNSRIEIGCQTFRGSDFENLRNWALTGTSLFARIKNFFIKD